MNTINKKLAFPPSLHWVALIGKTTPLNFIQDFGFRNTAIKVLTSQSIILTRDIIEPVDCFPMEVIADLPKHTLQHLIEDLKRLAIEKHCPVFGFSRSYEDKSIGAEPDIYTYLSYNEEIKGGYIWKSQGHPIGAYALEPPSNAKEEALKKSPSEIQIEDLLKTRGFHMSFVSLLNAAALIRGDKTDIICSASHNVQKGDWLVLSVDGIIDRDIFNPINEIVWEVSFVSNIPLSRSDNEYGQVALSLKRIANATYHRGGIDDEYIDECIVFNDNRKD